MLPHRIGQIDADAAKSETDSFTADTASQAINNSITAEANDDDADKLNELEPSDSTSDNGVILWPKIDNLHAFPCEILEKIFFNADDVGLLNLADTCIRFEAIAQKVFSLQYADKYFLIECEDKGGDPEFYSALLDRFGSNLNHFIQVNCIEDIDSNHWVAKLLQPRINQIKGLTFDNCIFKAQDIWPQSMDNVTHLSFQNVSFASSQRTNTFDLPDCRKLIELDIYGTRCFPYDSIERTIRNNPALQSVKLSEYDSSDENDDYSVDYLQIVTLIADNLNGIKELELFDCYEGMWKIPESDAIEKIVHSFQQLETLKLSVDSNTIELLQCLGTECKKIKELELYHVNLDYYLNSEIVQALRSFQQVESLYLCDVISPDDMNSLVDCWPNLRYLRIAVNNNHSTSLSSIVLSLFCECPLLEKINVGYGSGSNVDVKNFLSAKFYKKFIDTLTITKKPNARFNVTKGSTMGSICKNGIVCRNKLMHWIGCDKNDTNIKLLDLANQSEQCDEKSKGSNQLKRDRAVQQINLLDRIFDYLDMDSLSSFAQTSPRSKTLVEDFIKKRFGRNEMLTITNEFKSSKYVDRMHHMFTPYVTHVKVYSLDMKFYNMISKFKCLTKLSLHIPYHMVFRLPKLPKSICHVVLDIGFFTLDSLRYIFRNNRHIEILELKIAGDFIPAQSDEIGGLKFGNLKQIIFKCKSEIQFAYLKKKFKDINVQLVPIYPSSAKN